MKCLKIFVLFTALALPGWAQDSGDAPDHGVARISVLGGDVSVRRGDTGEFVAAELNAPLVALDHVVTEVDSRAEIQLDWANFVRLSSESEVRLAELKDRDFLIQVPVGTVTFRVLRDSQAQVEISTPTVAIRPRKQGTYRITVRDDFSTEVTVRSGEAEIFAGGKSDVVHKGQTLVVSGDPENPQLAYSNAIPKDDFDKWNDARDQALDQSDSYKYVSRDVYGAEDLAGYGRWVYDPPNGWVWVPNVAVSWAPYRVGRWTWVDYYGWTWVSGDPWGWAPYHYGRWYHAPRYGWVWYPGEVHVRYYWRPALVGFFGWGVNVGWVALAPREVYRPWYGAGRTVVTNVTYVNNINVVNTYRNARFVSGRSGVTSIVAGNISRKITINNYVVAKDSDLKRAGNADRWLPHEPSRENRQFSERRAPHVNTKPDVDPRFVSTRPEWNTRDRRDNTRRVDASPRNDRNDSDRGRQLEGNRGRGENPAAPVAGNRPDSVRRDENPRPVERVTASGNDSARGRQPESNRGRGENPAAPVAGNRPDSVRRDENPRPVERVTAPGNDSARGRQPESNRGRGENPAAPVAGNRPDNARREENPRPTEPVTFPRNDSDRGRQPEGNRGRSDIPSPVAGNTPGTVRRDENPRRNEPVTFPRNDSTRGRQPEGNGGRSEVPAVPVAGNTPGTVRRDENPRRGRQPESNSGRSEPAPSPVAGNRPDNVRREENPRRNEPVTFPRNDSDRGRGNAGNSVPSRPNEPERTRQAEISAGRAPVFARPEVEQPRPSPASETLRRAEPASRTSADSVPQRAPQPQERPGRFPSAEREQPRENPRPASNPAPRMEPRNSAPPPQPQASSPAPSAPPASGNNSSPEENNSGGRGRGRDRR